MLNFRPCVRDVLAQPLPLVVSVLIVVSFDRREVGIDLPARCSFKSYNTNFVSPDAIVSDSQGHLRDLVESFQNAGRFLDELAGTILLTAGTSDDDLEETIRRQGHFYIDQDDVAPAAVPPIPAFAPNILQALWVTGTHPTPEEPEWACSMCCLRQSECRCNSNIAQNVDPEEDDEDEGDDEYCADCDNYGCTCEFCDDCNEILSECTCSLDGDESDEDEDEEDEDEDPDDEPETDEPGPTVNFIVR